ncbi:MAG: hypothetical protein ACYTGC_12250 [Planctomycetota bacterium]|jgi:hypothetical protein
METTPPTSSHGNQAGDRTPVASPGVRLEPLPSGFDDELREIDLLLQANAARTSVPRDLADTVYDMTVGLLWQRQQPLPFKPAARRMQTVWSRLAMAASLALAFLVAAWFMQAPLETGPVQMVAEVPLSELDWILLEPSGSDTMGVGYLLESGDVTFEELTEELKQLVDQLEL